jgi:NAD(P)H-flavin reductase
MDDRYQAEIIEIIDESPIVKRFLLRLVNVFKFEFSPGQFVIVDFPDIEHEYPYRSYSIASTTKRHKVIELCVVLKENGAATPGLFKDSRVGDRLTVSEPQGKFVLPKELDRDICFICTGTGIAPFRSMILDVLEKGLPHKNIYLIFGNRTEEDILYREEFERLDRDVPHFHFIPTLSRQDWEGETGYVHPIYTKLFDDKRDAYFYICGWTKMVREAKNNLKAMGYDRRSIKIETYD